MAMEQHKDVVLNLIRDRLLTKILILFITNFILIAKQ